MGIKLFRSLFPKTGKGVLVGLLAVRKMYLVFTKNRATDILWLILWELPKDIHTFKMGWGSIERDLTLSVISSAVSPWMGLNIRISNITH